MSSQPTRSSAASQASTSADDAVSAAMSDQPTPSPAVVPPTFTHTATSRPGAVDSDYAFRPRSWRNPRDWASLLLIEAVYFYRVAISPLKPVPTCRFSPTCSAYALEALQVHGLFRGLWLSTIRILKCAPWHPGGYDPVPPPRHHTHPRQAAPTPTEEN